jgi:ABC-type transporter Mla MlaB component
MNTINTQKTDSTLDVTVNGAFNLHARNQVKQHITADIEKLSVDFDHCHLIDTKGVVFLFQWQQSGNSLELTNPPDMLFEIIELLALQDHWELNTAGVN